MPSPTMPAMNWDTQGNLYDQDGNLLISVGMQDTVEMDGGATTKRRKTQSIQLMCGSMWNPSYSSGDKPIMMIAVCGVCRNPPWRLFVRERPAHGLCDVRKGRVCARCGRFLCPGHAHRGRDRRFRCPMCASHNRAFAFIRSIFFKYEHED